MALAVGDESGITLSMGIAKPGWYQSPDVDLRIAHRPGGWNRVRAGLDWLEPESPTGPAWPATRVAALATILGADAYTLLSGLSVPAQRSYLMVAVAMIALLLQRLPRPAGFWRSVVGGADHTAGCSSAARR